MRLRALWAQAVGWYAAHSTRDRRIVTGVGALAALSVLYVGVVQPLVHYRQRGKTEIEEGEEQLERAEHFLAVADAKRAERDELRKKLGEAKERLLPGSSATLGAAALQERANALAAEKGITVQSTQVMKEEAAEPFHKIAIRLTLSGELKPFAEFVSGLEYGPQQLSIPFLEVSRRGAAAAAVKGPRVLQATVEVSGYLQGAEPTKAEAEPGEGEGEAAPGAPEGEAAPGASEGEAAPGASEGEAAPGAPEGEAAPGAPGEASPGGPAASSEPPAAAPAPPAMTPAPAAGAEAKSS